MHFIKFSYFMVLLLHCYGAFKEKHDYIQRFEDHKDFKKFIKTHNNVLAVFTKNEKDFKEVKLFSQVAESVKGIGSVVHVDCGNAKKLCKKVKTSPSTVEYKHFKDGEFHKDYDRQLTFKSLRRFMEAPGGDVPWDEDPYARDVHHVEKLNDLKKLLSKSSKPLLVMFYAPWCGFCKRLKPDYAAAATSLKKEAVLVGMDVDTSQGSSAKGVFNITAFPTIIYFKDGEKKFDYGGEMNKEGIIQWMRDPQPPKPKEPEKEWSDVPSDVIHLTDDNFQEVIQQGQPTLVMFYAPWCGHCKNMKPEYQDAATKIKELGLGGILAAVDATKHKKVADNFTITGYPTVIFFKDGKEMYNMNERSSQKIVDFIKSPKEPEKVEEEAAWDSVESPVNFLGGEEFKAFVKKKKHSLVIFYAPWCGHCKAAKPEFTEAAKHFKEDNKRAFIAVDCTKHNSLCSLFEVKGYPTIIYLNYGKNPKPYLASRTANDFISFMSTSDTSTTTTTTSAPGLNWQEFPNSQVIHQLTSDSLDDFIAFNSYVLVFFYATNCAHCHAMRKDFIEAATQLQHDKVEVKFTAVDAMQSDQVRDKYNIRVLPTIKAFRNQEQLLEFADMPRTKENLIRYVNNPTIVLRPSSLYRPKAGLQDITSTDQLETISSQNKALLVLFHDPFTPAYVEYRPTFWGSASEATNLGAKFGLVNCAQQQDICRREKISGSVVLKLYQGGLLYSDVPALPTPSQLSDHLKSILAVKTEL